MLSRSGFYRSINSSMFLRSEFYRSIKFRPCLCWVLCCWLWYVAVCFGSPISFFCQPTRPIFVNQQSCFTVVCGCSSPHSQSSLAWFRWIHTFAISEKRTWNLIARAGEAIVVDPILLYLPQQSVWFAVLLNIVFRIGVWLSIPLAARVLL